MIIIYSSLLKGWIAYLRRTPSQRAMLAVKPTRLEAIMVGLDRLALIRQD